MASSSQSHRKTTDNAFVRQQTAFTRGRPEIRTDGTAEVHLAQTYYPGVLKESFFHRRTATAGADGVYSIAHLPPGRYKLVAVSEPVDDYPEIRACEDQMETIEVGPKEKVTKDLKLRIQTEQ